MTSSRPSSNTPTTADLLATGAAAPSFVKACLCDAAPWTALRRRLPRAAHRRSRPVQMRGSASSRRLIGGRGLRGDRRPRLHRPRRARDRRYQVARSTPAARRSWSTTAAATRPRRSSRFPIPRARGGTCASSSSTRPTRVGRPGAPYLAVARLRGKRSAAARRRTAARLGRLMQLGVFCFPRRRSAAPTSF